MGSPFPGAASSKWLQSLRRRRDSGCAGAIESPRVEADRPDRHSPLGGLQPTPDPL